MRLDFFIYMPEMSRYFPIAQHNNVVCYNPFPRKIRSSNFTPHFVNII